MPNKYTKEGKELVENEFIKEELIVKGETFDVYKYLPRLEDVIHCAKMAKAKSKFTMDISQASIPRDMKIKVSKTFNGMMAELAIHRFFILFFNINSDLIKRFDYERNDFKYTKDEYDLKVFLDGNWHDIESRSSISFKTTLQEAVEKYDLIGPYTNDFKVNEELNSIYIRPLYQYDKVEDRDENELANLINDFYYSKVSLYLVTGAFEEDFSTMAYNKTMGQGRTEYRVIKMTNLGGMNKFIKRFLNKYPNN